MLSAINACENRGETLKFLLQLVLERSGEPGLQEAAILACNKHNDSVLTLLMKNHEVFRETRQLFFKESFRYQLDAVVLGFRMILTIVAYQEIFDCWTRYSAITTAGKLLSLRASTTSSSRYSSKTPARSAVIAKSSAKI